MKNILNSLKKLFGDTTVIDEASMTVKKRKFSSITLIFFVVFMIGSLLANFLWGIPTTAYLLNNEEFKEAYFDASFDEAALNNLLNESIEKMPNWMDSFELFMTAGIILVCIGYCTKYERRRLFTLGFIKKGAIKEYAAGLGIGLAMFSAAYGIMLLSGQAQFHGFNSNISIPTIILFFFGFVVQGMSEEILFRGYYMVSAATTGNVPLAVFGSSMMFAIMHLSNIGIGALSMINVFLFGIFASLYFLRRGSIWGIAAIHSVWNFAQGSIFGCNISGTSVSESIFSTSISSGNTLFNGGIFGPEGGLGVTIILFIGIMVLTFMDNKKILPEINFGKEFFSAF